jgi:hypothetical protein
MVILAPPDADSLGPAGQDVDAGCMPLSSVAWHLRAGYGPGCSSTIWRSTAAISGRLTNTRNIITVDEGNRVSACAYVVR